MWGVSPRNGFGELVAGLVFVFVPALYLLPTYEAWKREHDNWTSVAMVNILLGWSLIGWVVAMVWAVRKPATVMVIPSNSTHPISESQQPQPKRDTKVCPFCAEEVMAAAIKCKHCGSDLSKSD
jgi:hypothetical protein